MCRLLLSRLSILFVLCISFCPTVFAECSATEGNCQVLNCIRCTGGTLTKSAPGAEVTIFSPKSEATQVPVPPADPKYSACIPCGCGDGKTDTDPASEEECDDKNYDNLDGCDVFCRKEYCGDRMVNNLKAGGEQCDDGNDCNTDDCPSCKNAICGDGHTWANNEECDDANTTATDECVSCKKAYCGDNHVWAGHEQCDGHAYCENCKCTGKINAPACPHGAHCTVKNHCGQCVAWGCNPPPRIDRCGHDACNWNVCNACGCFPDGVKILMADGSTKAAEDIKFGDKVRLVGSDVSNVSMGGSSERTAYVMKITEGPEDQPLVEFGSAGKNTRVSSLHVVPTAAGLKRAEDLKIGDKVRNAQNQEVTIDHLQRIPVQEGQVVRNFTLGNEGGAVENHLMISDGYVTGDTYLQNNLKSILEK